jgi:microcystin-dependent protein
MSEPNEPLTGLIIPNTGDQPGAWGTASINPNFTAIGGMFGGFQTISLSSGTTIALTAPSGSITPGAGPTQQQNAMLRFTGSQSGTATIQFSKPGRYVIDHQASTAFPIVLAPASGTGTQIGAPWWRKCAIFFDGTNVDYENPPEPGSAIDLHGLSAIPNWMLVCTKQYALIKDGSTYSTAAYSGLFSVVGSTFGGNGLTTFGVPDERNRMRIPIDSDPGTGFSNRVTGAGSGISGKLMGSTGGDQLMQAHNHASPSLTDPGNIHGVPIVIFGNTGGSFIVATNNLGSEGTSPTNSTTTGITIGANVGTTGSGGSQNMPLTIVSFLPLIKT